MTKIDGAFCTIQWEDLYADLVLHALSFSTLDHCPLLLSSQEHVATPPIFRFKAYWLHMPGFLDCVQEAWHKPLASPYNALQKLHIKLSRTAKALATSTQSLVPQGELAVALCRDIITQLDSAHEHRALSDDELNMKKIIKVRLLGLVAIEHSRAQQKSRLTWLRLGDGNTKYFLVIASVRKRQTSLQLYLVGLRWPSTSQTSKGSSLIIT
jgi:hypothetical protein